MTTFRVLVADDEPLARDQLERFVLRHDALELVGTAATGIDAIRQIDATKPDVVFLDIRMPGASGIEVARRARHQPRIVFTTAYDEYAVTAFELQALDYLLKPFGRRRFDKTVERLIAQGPVADRRSLDPGFDKEPIDQLYVRDRGRSRRVPVDSIVRVEAADDYARVVTVDGSSFLVSVRMKGLAACLDTNRFVRVHRSLIVNAQRIETITDAGNGRRVLTLSDGTTCTASRSGAARLRALFANRRPSRLG